MKIAFLLHKLRSLQRSEQSYCVLYIRMSSVVQSIKMVSVAKFYLGTEGRGHGDVNLQAQMGCREIQLSTLAVLYP